MPQYSDILDELSLKLREGDSAAKALYLSEKKNRVLKAENASLYKKIDEAQAVLKSHETFIENLTECNARLLQENRQLRQIPQGAENSFKEPSFVSDSYQIRFPFYLDAFWGVLNK